MNGQRAERAERLGEVLKIYAQPGDTPATTAVRLLEDLRHWCDAEDIEFRYLHELAHGRYLELLAAERWRVA